MATEKKWIQGAIEHPGALRARARAEGAMTEGGTIKKSWLRAKAKENSHVGRQARLALTLSERKH